MVTLGELTVIGAPLERVFDLARSVEVHLLGNVHSGEQACRLRAWRRGCWAWGTA